MHGDRHESKEGFAVHRRKGNARGTLGSNRLQSAETGRPQRCEEEASKEKPPELLEQLKLPQAGYSGLSVNFLGKHVLPEDSQSN